jgi:hypothetical protein
MQSSGFASLRDKPLSIGLLIYPNMDQIDFTGPFEVPARIPPEMALGEAPELDVLGVPGGPGQEAIIRNEPATAREFSASSSLGRVLRCNDHRGELATACAATRTRQGEASDFREIMRTAIDGALNFRPRNLIADTDS